MCTSAGSPTTRDGRVPDHRGRTADRNHPADSLDAGQANLGERQGRRRHPLAAAQVLRPGRRRGSAVVRSTHGRERDIHAGVPHPGFGRERVPDRCSELDLVDRRSRPGAVGAQTALASVVLKGVAPRPARSAPMPSGSRSSRPRGTSGFGLVLLARQIGWKETRGLIHFRKKDKDGKDDEAGTGPGGEGEPERAATSADPPPRRRKPESRRDVLSGRNPAEARVRL